MINTAYYCDDGLWLVQTEQSRFKAPCDTMAFYLPVALFYEDGAPIFTADSLDMLRRADDYCYYRKLREKELNCNVHTS